MDYLVKVGIADMIRYIKAWEQFLNTRVKFLKKSKVSFDYMWPDFF